MLLAKATIDSTAYRFSDRQHNLAHPWRSRIKTFSSPTRSMAANQGGWLQWSDGSIVMSPNFSPVWPPPETFDLEIYNSDDGENLTQWFDGSTYIADTDLTTSIPYKLYAGAYSQTVDSGHVFSGTLVSVFTWAAGQLGLTLNSDLSRTVSTPIVYTMTRDAYISDVLDSMCKYATHMWWVDRPAAVLYLLDMGKDNGSRTVKSSQIFKPTYPKLAPTSEMTATVNGTNVTRMSSFADGKTDSVQPYHTSTTYVGDELDRALAILNARRMSLELPLDNNIPAPGEKITFVNEKTYQSTAGWFRVRSYEPMPELKKIRVSGEGVLA